MSVGEFADKLSDIITEHGDDLEIMVMDPLGGDFAWTTTFKPIIGRTPEGKAMVLLFPHPEMARVVNEDGVTMTVADVPEIEMDSMLPVD